MGTESTTRRSRTAAEGVEVRYGKRGSNIRITFYFNDERCREPLDIPDTPSNIKYAINLRGEILARLAKKTFDYAEFFPNSPKAGRKNLTASRPTIGELVKKFIDDGRKTKAHSPSSTATYAKWNRSRIEPKFGDTYADELTTSELRSWIVELISELSPKSVRNCVGVLSAVLTLNHNDEVIAKNPLAPISLKAMLPARKKSVNDKVDPFNAAEISAILNACPSQKERAFFMFAFATGMRTGELIALKWRHIDWVNGLIHVEDNVVIGEGVTVEKGTKTDVERDIPMLPAARAALTIMRPITSMLKNGDYIFTYDGNNRWRDDHQIRDRWRIILKLAKVRYRNPYQTRHTFASTLLMNGEPEILVANLLGHATVEMIRRHYHRFIKQPNGISLKSDYAEFGAELGQTACTLKSANDR